MSERRFHFDRFGVPVEEIDISGMLDARRCGICGHVHDTATATRVARYVDCDVWLCPNCNGQQDNRDFLTGPMHARRVGQR